MASALINLARLLQAQGSYEEARHLHERGPGLSLAHLSKNMGAMTEIERFRYLDTQAGPEPLLLNLVAMQGRGPVPE